ncbi:MAG: FAD-dependent oxidoreductase [Gammaproteobacteria bacterium]
MSIDNRYAVLFEPVRIGPLTAKNRFFQVPHCCGFGHLRPQGHAAMRGVKAEGGWAVVSTEEAEIHPSSDLSPYSEQRIWDERDIPALSLMTEAVHAHDALAAIELAHNGYHGPNRYTRIAPLAPSHMTVKPLYPMQARAMNKRDIRELRQWHRQAVSNAKLAGFDIVYVYASHYMSIAQQFLSPQLNQRNDEYGGSLENRTRLTRELLEDAQEEAAGECAIAFRFAVDDLMGADGMQAHEEGRAVVQMLSDLPDLWDVNVAGWENDSQTSRFAPDEGYQEEYIAFVKQVTDKPVVGVGRYTSPDRMASIVRDGIVDLIGAARPSIADPFLPNKIRDGRIDEICECIGCNICVAADSYGVPIRCTQNPTIGEEWRRGWHPERATPKTGDDSVLVIGAGPAGLECARHLGERDYTVVLAESERELGGRALLESRLKGLSTWRRVQDYREQTLARKPNVSIYRDSALTAVDVLEFDFPHAIIATGATWRRDGVGRSQRRAIEGLDKMRVLTPNDIMRGTMPDPGPVMIYDDEHAYMGGVIADHICAQCEDITFVTSASVVSPWTAYTLEQERVQASLIRQGVTIHVSRKIAAVHAEEVETACVYTRQTMRIPCTTLILVTERLPNAVLASDIQQKMAAHPGAALRSVQTIGDALAPGLIADAVFSGHLAARNFQRDPQLVNAELFERETPSLARISHHDDEPSLDL